MNFKLATNESIIKSYNYSSKELKSKGPAKQEPLQNSLIITNKRIIEETVSDKTIIRKEIPVQAADYVSTSYAASATSLMIAIALAVLGIVGIIIGAMAFPPLIFIGVISLVMCVIMLVLYFLRRGAGVTVEISGKMGEHSLISMGASSMAAANKIKRIKIKVDKTVAQTMVNEIGAILLDVKASVPIAE